METEERSEASRHPTGMLNPAWLGKNPAEDERVAVQYLFHDCSAEAARWALTTRISWNPLGLYRERCPLEH